MAGSTALGRGVTVPDRGKRTFAVRCGVVTIVRHKPSSLRATLTGLLSERRFLFVFGALGASIRAHEVRPWFLQLVAEVVSAGPRTPKIVLCARQLVRGQCVLARLWSVLRLFGVVRRPPRSSVRSRFHWPE
jgi:hypothetical protein